MFVLYLLLFFCMESASTFVVQYLMKLSAFTFEQVPSLYIMIIVIFQEEVIHWQQSLSV